MAAQLAYAPRSDPEPERQPFYRRRPCPHCRGGVTDAPLTPYCSRCHQSWSAARFDALMEACDRGVSLFGWRLFRGTRYHWRTLPCGCSAEHLHYRVTLCRMCGGTGVRYHEATRDDLLRSLGAAPASLMSPARAYRPRVPGVPTVPPMTSF